MKLTYTKDAGVVLKVGSKLLGFLEGDKVLLSFNSCSSCQDGRLGYTSYCQSYAAQNFGGQREDGTKSLTLTDSRAKLSSHFFGQSSFAEIALVSSRCMVKVPESTNLALFAPLGCGIQTSARTVLNTLDVKEDQSLAAFGIGAIRLSYIIAAKLRAASPIITIDVNQARLELAKELGATHTILSRDKTLDVPKEIRRISSGNSVFRAADYSGIPVVIEQTIKSLRSRGKAATMGSPAPGVYAKIDIFAHIVKGTHYIGSYKGDSNLSKIIPYLIHKQTHSNFLLNKIVTLCSGKDYKKAFKDIQSGKVVKGVLRWVKDSPLDVN